jgi:Bax protein
MSFKIHKSYKRTKNKILNTLTRFSLSALIVALFFYTAPIFINFADKNFNNKEFTNNSKNILNKTLNNGQIFEQDDKFSQSNEMDLLYDILEENNSEINLVRYTTSEINSLFKEVKYDLEEVRDTKLVKPIDIGLLPNEIKNIANTKKRKEMFIKIVLPLIVKENNKIRVDRKRLFSILNKNSNSEIEKKWLEKKYKQYGVRKNDLSTLKVRMDEIPVSLAIAQAAKETGWGTSRFALKGNALFGQWTWSGDGLKPKNAQKGEEHKVMKFHSLQLSVRAYLRNLNTHSSYKNLRRARTELRNRNKLLDSIILSNHLDKYAETGNEYIQVLQKIIKQNDLKDFDEARLLPSSKDLESLI